MQTIMEMLRECENDIYNIGYNLNYCMRSYGRTCDKVEKITKYCENIDEIICQAKFLLSNYNGKVPHVAKKFVENLKKFHVDKEECIKKLHELDEIRYNDHINSLISSL